MKVKLIETRGRKRLKQYNLKAGDLAKFKLSELQNIRYQARKEGWVISVRKVEGKLLVFRKS